MNYKRCSQHSSNCHADCSGLTCRCEMFPTGPTSDLRKGMLSILRSIFRARYGDSRIIGYFGFVSVGMEIRQSTQVKLSLTQTVQTVQ